MQSALLQQSCTKAVSRSTVQRHQRQRQLRLTHVQSQSGRSEPFNEGAVQVKRLVDRDRAQMLGNQIDILDKFETEFGDPDQPSTSPRPAASAAVADAPASTSTSTSTPANSSSTTTAEAAAAPKPAAPAAAAPAAAKPAAPAAVKTNFGAGGGVASPFGGPARSTRSNMEPLGLSPDMSPDPIVKMAPTPGNIISKITLTQVVLFCTFSSMIGLMLATFSVVVKSGAVRLAGIE